MFEICSPSDSFVVPVFSLSSFDYLGVARHVLAHFFYDNTANTRDWYLSSRYLGIRLNPIFP
jgi:hypothetical protein